MFFHSVATSELPTPKTGGFNLVLGANPNGAEVWNGNSTVYESTKANLNTSFKITRLTGNITLSATANPLRLNLGFARVPPDNAQNLADQCIGPTPCNFMLQALALDSTVQNSRYGLEGNTFVKYTDPFVTGGITYTDRILSLDLTEPDIDIDLRSMGIIYTPTVNSSGAYSVAVFNFITSGQTINAMDIALFFEVVNG